MLEWLLLCPVPVGCAVCVDYAHCSETCYLFRRSGSRCGQFLVPCGCSVKRNEYCSLYVLQSIFMSRCQTPATPSLTELQRVGGRRKRSHYVTAKLRAPEQSSTYEHASFHTPPSAAGGSTRDAPRIETSELWLVVAWECFNLAGGGKGSRRPKGDIYIPKISRMSSVLHGFHTYHELGCVHIDL